MKLERAIEQYIELKQSLGFRFRTQSYILRAFSRSVGPVNVSQVKPTAARVYLEGRGPVTRTWSLKWSTLRGFYRYVMARGLVRRSPLPLEAPRVATAFTPYIYTLPELERLLDVITPERARSVSSETMRTLILLLYGAGLRLSEALNLEDSRVDLEEALLLVQRSKFFKSRLVPIGPKLVKVLADYQSSRPPIHGSHQWFFRTTKGQRPDSSTVGRVFRCLRDAAGITRRDGSPQLPRLHDLRHSMATHCLLKWYREGADVQSLLVQLSAYLGHARIVDTQPYLTVTAELREQAGQRFACYAWGGDHE